MLDNSRRSFFFGATLSEIGFILFFSLLLFAFYQHKSDEETLADMEAKAQLLQRQIAAREQALKEAEQMLAFNSGEEREKYWSELVQRKDLQIQLEALETRNSELEEEAKKYDSLKKVVDDLAVNKKDPVKTLEEAMKIKEELEQQLGKDDLQAGALLEALELRDLIENMADELDVSLKNAEDIKSLATDYRDLLGQNRNLRKQLGGRGLPPCWADQDTGKIEYLFYVLVSDEQLVFSSAAPSYRKQEYANLPNVDLLTQSSVDLDRFKRLAAPILGLSDENECRHYVSITYISDTTQETTLTIEDYFYKFVNRS